MKKILKKALALTLAALMLASTVTGCGSESESTDTTTTGVTAVDTTIELLTDGNPITGFDENGDLMYNGDPAALVDGDTVYIYCGHDASTNNNYNIPEWVCYSTTDMENFTYEGVMITCSEVSFLNSDSSWAAQTTKHYDEESGTYKYYMYICGWNTTSSYTDVGVVVADSPTGPFYEVETSLLIDGMFTNDSASSWSDIDPTVWCETDEDGVEHRYLMWGNSNLYICELNEDMVSVKDLDGDGNITYGTDVVSLNTPGSYTEAPWIYRRQDEDGNYYGDYYLFYAYGWREQMAYVTTSDLFSGDWSKPTVIMGPTATSNTNHMSVIDFKGTTYFIYHNGSLSNGSGYRRVICATTLTFDEDGNIEPIEETAAGLTNRIAVLKDSSGNILYHTHFTNTTSDGDYPIEGVYIGVDLENVTDEDGYWMIREQNGEYDEEGAFYVSIESYNKPGCFWTGPKLAVQLTHDYSGYFGNAQTYRVVEALNGSGGISFESAQSPGKYVTLSSAGTLLLTDGSDADACSFTIEYINLED